MKPVPIKKSDWWWAGDSYLRVVRDKAIAQREAEGLPIPNDEEWWLDSGCRRIKKIHEDTRDRLLALTGKDIAADVIYRLVRTQNVQLVE